MPRDFFQYLIKVCRIFVAADLAGGFDKALTLVRVSLFILIHAR